MSGETARAAFEAAGFAPSPEQSERFAAYFALLSEWNQKVNLTAVADEAGVYEKHFADSLLALPLVEGRARVADVGTGAGFPGVPLLIARPDIRLTLIDSVQKKLDFLSALLARLGLFADLVHARAEDAARTPGLRDGFDAVLSRAVAPMNVLLELTLPFAKTNGAAVCFKGPALSEELPAAGRALLELNGRVEKVIAYAPPWGERRLALVLKTAPTPKKYPRKAGTPAKEPLC